MSDNKWLRRLSLLRADTKAIWRTEIDAIKGDAGVLLFFFFVPIVYPFLYAAFYNTEVVEESKLVVVDEDNSSLSREYIRRVDASQEVEVVAVVPTIEQAEQMIMDRDAYGYARIPKNFQADLYRGADQVHVELMSLGNVLLYYKNYMVALNNNALQMGGEIHAERAGKPTKALTDIEVRPVYQDGKGYYNPVAGIGTFLMPPILILILQQTLILGICMLAATARESNDTHYLIPSTIHGPMRMVINKSVIYFVLYFLLSIWVLCIVPYCLRILILTTPMRMLIFIVPYLLSVIFMSIGLSFLFKRREVVLIYIVPLSLVFFFLTGVVWPWQNIPWLWKSVAYLIPSTHAVQGYIALLGTGASLYDILHQCRALWVLTALYFTIASTGYYFQYRHGRQRRDSAQL